MAPARRRDAVPRKLADERDELVPAGRGSLRSSRAYACVFPEKAERRSTIRLPTNTFSPVPSKESLAGPDVKAALEKQAMDVAEPGTPASFAAFLKSDLAKWQEVVKKAHVKVD